MEPIWAYLTYIGFDFFSWWYKDSQKGAKQVATANVLISLSTPTFMLKRTDLFMAESISSYSLFQGW